MSGGAYNYAYLKVLGVLDDIRVDIQDGNFDKDIIGDVEELVDQIVDISVVLRSLEWYMSGDTSKERFKEVFNDKFKKEITNV